jgi:hypothetical protein
LEEPLAVAMPHCAPRNVQSREPVIKSLQKDGTWVELPTKEVVLDGIKVRMMATEIIPCIRFECVVQEYKFVEVRLDAPDATLTVVTRIRRETFAVQKRGGKVNSSVDSRVCFCFKQGTFKTGTEITLEVSGSLSN